MKKEELEAGDSEWISQLGLVEPATVLVVNCNGEVVVGNALLTW